MRRRFLRTFFTWLSYWMLRKLNLRCHEILGRYQRCQPNDNISPNSVGPLADEMLWLCGLILGDEFVINDSCLLINSAAARRCGYAHHPSTATELGHYVVRCHATQPCKQRCAIKYEPRKLSAVHERLMTGRLITFLHFMQYRPIYRSAWNTSYII